MLINKRNGEVSRKKEKKTYLHVMEKRREEKRRS